MVAEQKKQMKYQKIKLKILNWIEENRFGETGNCLPSELELCNLFQGSRMTIRKALKELTDEGVLVRVKGKGTFIKHHDVISQSLQYLTGFSEDMMERGITPDSQILLCEQIAATNEIAEKLQLLPGDDVVMLRRLRLANKEPIAIETSYLNSSLFGDSFDSFDFKCGSLYHYLQKTYNINLKWAKQSIEAAELYDWEAQLLGKPELKIALLTHRQTFDVENHPVEYAVCKYRSDKYKYHVELLI